jgi:hypothetical protein
LTLVARFFGARVSQSFRGPVPDADTVLARPERRRATHVATALRDRDVDLPRKACTEIEGNLALKPCPSLKTLTRSAASILLRIAELTAPVLAGQFPLHLSTH